MTDALTAAGAERLADALRELPGVREVTITHADQRHDERRTVEVFLPEQYDRVPPRVMRALAEHDAGLADVTPQGGFVVAVAF